MSAVTAVLVRHEAEASGYMDGFAENLSFPKVLIRHSERVFEEESAAFLDELVRFLVALLPSE